MPKTRGTRISSDYSSKGYLFGWCLDGLHEKCWEWIPHRGLRCQCDCHITSKENGND